VAKAKAIIKRRKAVVNTRKITKTMELVSTAKYKQSFNRITSAMPYRKTLQDVMQDLAQASGEVQHPLLARRDPPQHVTLLLITSNRGLAGGFNSNLVRASRVVMAEARAGGATLAIHVAGKKGILATRHGREAMTGEYAHFGDKPTFAAVEVLADEFLQAYAAGRTDRVVVVYQQYLSAAVQRPIVQTLLPLAPPQGAEGASRRRADYIFSPDAESILKQLLPAYFKTSLYHAFLENVVGEHRARMVAMKNATDNAEEMIRSLTRRYNRARQSQITNEIAEIMGGVEALK
jgi:F-type H+-transporting ATPase subunit gamma